MNMPDCLHLVPEHARPVVQAILEGSVTFDYIDVLSDQTVRIGRYPDGYQLPDAPASQSAQVSETETDLFLLWQGRF